MSPLEYDKPQVAAIGEPISGFIGRHPRASERGLHRGFEFFLAGLNTSKIPTPILNLDNNSNRVLSIFSLTARSV